MSKPQIFISHTSEESDFAIPIKNWIDENLLGGVNLFVSSDNGESIPLGTEWPKKIKNSLEKSNVLVVLVSHQSKFRRWIYFEAGAGYVRDIPVIPICIGGLERIEIPTPLNFLQALKFPSPTDEEQLLKAIANVADLRSPKVISPKLKLPNRKIVEPESITHNSAKTDEGFKKSFHRSQIELRVIDFFKVKLHQSKEFTLTEIELGIDVKGTRKRHYILEFLENMLESELIEKRRKENTLWKLTMRGIKTITSLQ